MRQMNATHPLIDVHFEFLTDKDFDKVDQVIRKAFDDANYSTGEEEKLVRRLRAGQPFGKRPIEIVAKRGDEVLGYVMVSGATVSDNRTGSSIAVVGPVVVDPLYRGRGIGWRLTQKRRNCRALRWLWCLGGDWLARLLEPLRLYPLIRVWGYASL